jgi:hypothetical protein
LEVVIKTRSLINPKHLFEIRGLVVITVRL